MTWGAYVFGDLSWPMPDLGLVAVWRAMPIDASRWGDWDGFVDGLSAGTIGGMVDRAGSGDAPGKAPFKLDLDENGVRLRAYFEQTDADWWKRLAIAWRAAADLGASGEFVWVPGSACPLEVAYHGVIGDYASRWEKREAHTSEGLAGRQEIDAMIGAVPHDLHAAAVVPDVAASAAVVPDVAASAAVVPDVSESVAAPEAVTEPEPSGKATKATPKKRASTKRGATKKPPAKKAAKKKR